MRVSAATQHGVIFVFAALKICRRAQIHTFMGPNLLYVRRLAAIRAGGNARTVCFSLEPITLFRDISKTDHEFELQPWRPSLSTLAQLIVTTGIEKH